MPKLTKHGFECGTLRAEALCDNAIRVLNVKTGQYVVVQTSPAGRKQWVSAGDIEKAMLPGYLKDGA